MDAFLWWSGAALWIVAGSVAILFAGERIIDWSLTRLKMKREFLAWAADRIAKRNSEKIFRG